MQQISLFFVKTTFFFLFFISYPTRSFILNPAPFYFLRHGQTDHNIQKRYTGQLDIPLNETGIQQAHAAAQLLQNKDIRLIISSPLQRAHQTATIIAQVLGVPVITCDNLKEAQLGNFEGSSLISDRPQLMAWEKGNIIIEGAESCIAFKERVAQGLLEALEHPGPILLVAHGGVCLRIFELFNMPRTHITNCAPLFFTFDFDTQSWMINLVESENEDSL